MDESIKYLFGPIPSRRLGRSLGVSPIPEQTCNYTCVYCQLGRTTHMTNKRQNFFPCEEILEEFRRYTQKEQNFDVVTVVGEGEPTLYEDLGRLLIGLKELTDKPVAVITNGALLYDKKVREDLCHADIVLPSMDAVDEEMFHKIDRPYGRIKFDQVCQGLIDFSKEYQGELYLEIMLLEGLNCDDESLDKFARMLKEIRYDRVYVNTAVRPPAEDNVVPADKETMERAAARLGAISIDTLTSGSFISETEDPMEAVVSICRRHPMNQFEIQSFLDSRNVENSQEFFERLNKNPSLTVVHYKGISTYRYKE